MIINKSGVAIRMSVEEMRVMGRNTQGVRLINLKGNDAIAAIAKIEVDKSVEDEEELEEGDESAVIPNTSDDATTGELFKEDGTENIEE